MSRMRNLTLSVARQMGCDLTQADKQLRVGLYSNGVSIAVLAKTLVDNGVITDAQLLATINAADAGVYPDEPFIPAASAGGIVAAVQQSAAPLDPSVTDGGV